MDTVLTVVIILVIIGLIAFIYWRRGGVESTKVKSLRAECRKQLNMPPQQADETIDRYIANLQQKHSNRSEEWYLEKILYDLQRDR